MCFAGDYSGAITVCKLETSGVKFITVLKVIFKYVWERKVRGCQLPPPPKKNPYLHPMSLGKIQFLKKYIYCNDTNPFIIIEIVKGYSRDRKYDKMLI